MGLFVGFPLNILRTVSFLGGVNISLGEEPQKTSLVTATVPHSAVFAVPLRTCTAVHVGMPLLAFFHRDASCFQLVLHLLVYSIETPLSKTYSACLRFSSRRFFRRACYVATNGPMCEDHNR